MAGSTNVISQWVARRPRMLLGLVLSIATTMAVLPGSAMAAAGDLDPSFSGDGIAVMPGENDGMAVDSRGRVVVLSGIGSTVERFLPDGTLDKSFSGDGTAAVPYAHLDGYARSVAVDAHDRIVVVGRAGADFAVGRITVSGGPDRSFDGDGYTFTKIARHAEAWAVGVDARGRIVVAGGAFRPKGGGFFALARYLPNGAADTSFSDDGHLHTQFPDLTNGPATAVAFDSKGRIVTLGTGNDPSGHEVFTLARYTPGGGLDPAFSDDGMLTTRIGPGGPFSFIQRGLAVDASNRILIASDSGQGDTSKFALARLRANGAFDSSFSGDGQVLTSFGSDFNRAYGVAIDHAQRIVAVGMTGNSRSPSAFALARYTSAGHLDPAFSGDGKVTTSIAPQSIAQDVAIDPAGHIVVSGQLSSMTPSKPNLRIAVARYLNG
jgi:uncharacterized delta-60 repeat protein